MRNDLFLRVLPLLLCLSACGMKQTAAPAICRVVLEEGTGFSAEKYVLESERGGELDFTLPGGGIYHRRM